MVSDEDILGAAVLMLHDVRKTGAAQYFAIGDYQFTLCHLANHNDLFLEATGVGVMATEIIDVAIVPGRLAAHLRATVEELDSQRAMQAVRSLE